MIGWATSVTSIPRSASSAIVESTRKGILSLRTSRTEISRPSGIIGLITRISALPSVRCCMFPGLFCQEGQGSGIVVDEILAIGVVEQKLGKGPGRLDRLHTSRRLAVQGDP